MKEFILGFLIGIFIGFMLNKYYISPTQPPAIEHIRGAERSELKPGTPRVEIVKKQSKQKGKVQVINPLADYEYKTDTLDFSGENYKLDIAVTQDKVRDTILVDYFLEIEHKETFKTDTLVITRTDTLKQTMVIEAETKFYERPAVVVTAGIVIGYLLKAVLGNIR